MEVVGREESSSVLCNGGGGRIGDWGRGAMAKSLEGWQLSITPFPGACLARVESGCHLTPHYTNIFLTLHSKKLLPQIWYTMNVFYDWGLHRLSVLSRLTQLVMVRAEFNPVSVSRLVLSTIA